jgi:DNA-binding NarL/FixJ family response regulator
MTSRSLILPLAEDGEPVRYVMIDDEPRYRQAIDVPAGLHLLLAGGYGSVEAFTALQRQPCHVVVLDLCLNRQTGDQAVLQGVRAIRQLAAVGHRTLIYTADERPEPIARCVAAGAAGYVSKYLDTAQLARAIDEIGRQGRIVADELHQALRQLLPRCRDIRLSSTLEETLVLIQQGLSDKQIAAIRHLSPRTIEDHKQKILAILGANLEPAHSFSQLARELGILPGDLVNDQAGQRPGRDLIARAMPWRRTRRRGREAGQDSQ